MDVDEGSLPASVPKKRTIRLVDREASCDEHDQKRASGRHSTRKNKDIYREILASNISDPVHKSDDGDEELQINNEIAKMDSSLLSDYIARQLHRLEPNLSNIESIDLEVPAQAIQDSKLFDGRRSLDDLPSFLESNTEKSKDLLSSIPSNTFGSPHTIVVTLSAMRAANITRVLRVYQTDANKIGKLFAKHIKLKEAIEFVKKTRINIAVGTPQRMLDLVEQGALSFSHVETLVIDGSHINQKRRGIFEQRETLLPLLRLVSRLKPKFVSLSYARKSRVLVF